MRRRLAAGPEWRRRPEPLYQAVNDAIAIYGKSGALLASFTEVNLWNGVGTTPCNGNSQGDPVVVYDWLADRFVITWFAFPIVGGRPASPFYQCIAASKTSDPVAGGWWLYAVRTDPGGTGQPVVGDLNDYGKFGLWHDCLYMGANLFRYDQTHHGTYDGVLFGSFSRADLYSGSPLTFSLGRLPTTSNAFTLVPSNNQGTGANAAQPGTPNYFLRGQEIHCRRELRGRRNAEHCEQRQPNDVHVSAGRNCPAAEYDEHAGHGR